MKIYSEKKFFQWYIKTCDEKQFERIIEKINKKFPEKVIKNDAKGRQELILLWTKGANKVGIDVTKILQEENTAIKNALKYLENKSRESIRESLDNLLNEYGLRALGFALIVNPDKYTQEIGYELVNSNINNNEQYLGTSPGNSKKTICPTAENIPDNLDFVSMLTTLNNQIKSTPHILDIVKINEIIQELQQSINEYEKDLDTLKEMEKDIEQLLESINYKLPNLVDYLGLDVKLPLDKVEMVATKREDRYRFVEQYTNLNTICQEAESIVNEQPSNLMEEKDRIVRLQKINKKLQSSIDCLYITPRNEFILETENKQILALHSDIHEQIAPEGTLADKERQLSDDTPQLDEIPYPSEDNTDEHNDIKDDGNKIDLDVLAETEDSKPTTKLDEPKNKETSVEYNTEYEESDIDDQNTITKKIEPEYEKTDKDVSGIKHSENSIRYSEMVWKKLNDNDLASAYWMSREYEDNQPIETSVVLPSWMVLTSWMASVDRWDHSELIARMHDICYSHSQTKAELLGLFCESEYALICWLTAVATPAALLAPSTMAIGWLEEAYALLKNYDLKLYELLKEIHDYVMFGIPLNRSYILEAQVSKDWHDQTEQARTNVLNWRKTTESKTIKYLPAREVLKYLVGDQSPLKNAFTIINENNYEKGEDIRLLIDKHLINRKSMQELIQNSVNVVFSKSPAKPKFQVYLLEQLMRLLEELRTYLMDWVNNAQYCCVDDDKNNHVRLQTIQLVKKMDNLWPETKKEMEEIYESSLSDKPHKSSIIKLSIHLLNRFIQNILGREDYSLSSERWKDDLFHPLLLLKNSPLQDNGEIKIDDPFQPEESILNVFENGRTINQAIDLHIETRDLLLINLINQWCDKYNLDLKHEQETLRVNAIAWQNNTNRQFENVRSQLEQSRIDHVVSEEDYSIFESELFTIKSSESQRYGNISKQLENMKKQLNDLRKSRISSLEDTIKQIRSSIGNTDNILSNEELNPQAIKYLNEAEQYLLNDEMPLADEFIRFAELVIETGQDVEIDALEPVHTVTEFVKIINELMNHLEANEKTPSVTRSQLEKGKSFAGLDLTSVRKKQLEEAVQALDAWRQIKRNNLNMKTQLEKHLTTILKYMGFHQPSLKRIQEDTNSVHYRAEMSVASTCPLPEFGSQAAGIYDVVIIRDRPTIGRIEHIVTTYGLKGKTPILIYLGRFTLMQRQEWSTLCYKERFTALLVDELLLYYLASQRDDRLPATISCGIAWGYAVPYRSFGVIPPELFKGRREMTSQLGMSGGSCIVYGGRQLGKSVLLRSVQYRYHKPEQDMYVFYEDIRNLGNPQSIQDSHKSKIWWLLRQQLIANKLISNKSPEDTERIMNEIFLLMKDNPNTKIIFLLDEADSFLNADAETNFEDINSLKRLMDQTNRRFKVVLCGLHGVQRYCSGENHPFAQLMDKALVVGPLDPLAARMLIEQPMSAVGFSFESEDSKKAVLRILSYTNYHPALIQHFCAEIIKLVRKKKHEPPFQIRKNDVEAIYRRDEVRKVMNERFQWTLALDTRYETIVYSMIEEQYQERDGFRKEFSASQLLEHCRFWWPEGFASLPLEEMRALIEELIGLGILVKRINGQYRLRNANVVRALGSEKEIEEKLIQISASHAPISNEHNSNLRMELDFNKGVRSPLTIKQANDLTGFESGVGIVFGNKALGIDLVPETLKSIFRSGIKDPRKETRVIELPPEKINSKQIISYFKQHLKKENQYERIVVYNYLSRINIKDNLLSDLVNEVSLMLTKKTKNVSSIKWILLIDGSGTYQWLLDSNSESLENSIVTTCRLTNWDSKNIRNFLSLREILENDQMAKDILEITGGWPYLLNKMWILKDTLNEDNTLLNFRNIAGMLKEMLDEDDSRLSLAFLKSLDIDKIPGGIDLFKIIYEIKEVKPDEIVDISRISENKKLLSMSEYEIKAAIGALIRCGILKESKQGLFADPIVARAVTKCYI